MRSGFSLDLGDAQMIGAACLASAHRHGVAVSVAVMDGAGQLLHFARMDGARGFSVELAMHKARAAASVGVATAIIAARGGAGVPGAGGVPVLHLGQCAGAIGISGAPTDIDEAIAAAGLLAFSASGE